MWKIISIVILMISIFSEIIHSAPWRINEDPDILVPSSRLHRPIHHQLSSHMNVIPDVESTPMNEFIPHYRQNMKYAVPHEKQLEQDDYEQPETVFVDLKIDSSETHYVNLFIDTKRNFS